MTRLTTVLTAICLLLSLALAQPVAAAVTGTLAGGVTRPGSAMYLSLTLTADGSVAAINGQLSYNSAYFSNPTIQSAAGTQGFIALGNEVTPGEYKFVVYANPTSLFTLNLPTVYFRFDTASWLPSSGTTKMQFSLEAASDGEGVSLAGVDFQDLTLDFTRKNAIGEWAIYE